MRRITIDRSSEGHFKSFLALFYLKSFTRRRKERQKLLLYKKKNKKIEGKNNGAETFGTLSFTSVTLEILFSTAFD